VLAGLAPQASQPHSRPSGSLPSFSVTRVTMVIMSGLLHGQRAPDKIRADGGRAAAAAARL